MGWEKRGNNSYYYRKKRIGGKVFSQYLGTGFVAEEAVYRDLELRKSKQIEAGLIRQEREFLDVFNDQLKGLNIFVHQMTGGVLILAGFHKHKGQWRKKRYVTKQSVK